MAKKEEDKIDKLEKSISKLSKAMKVGFSAVDKKFEGVSKRFDGVDKKFDDVSKSIGDLAASTAVGFEKMHKYVDNRFEMVDIALLELRKDVSWSRDVIEKHAGWNLTLDQERIFTISRIDRLEKEINKVKAKIGVK
jgi:predicted  nucleic acid-binding Zn-ribbon protein